MTDSILPEADREFILGALKASEDRTRVTIRESEERLGARIEKLEGAQAEHEKALRDSTVTDLSHERKLADHALMLERLSAAAGAQAGAESGAVAGKESAEATAKKWAAIMGLVTLLGTIVNALLGRAPEPATPPERRAPTVEVAPAH